MFLLEPLHAQASSACDKQGPGPQCLQTALLVCVPGLDTACPTPPPPLDAIDLRTVHRGALHSGRRMGGCLWASTRWPLCKHPLGGRYGTVQQAFGAPAHWAGAPSHRTVKHHSVGL